MAPTRRRTSAVVGFAATAGFCLVPPRQLQCDAFSSSTTRSSRPAGGRSGGGVAGITSRSAIRSRPSSTRVCSTVDDVAKTVFGEKPLVRGNGHQTLPLNTAVDPERVLLGGAGSLSDGGGDARRAPDFDAVVRMADALTAPEGESGPQRLSSKSPEEKRIRKQRKGKEPEVVEGDDLANTPKMIALVWSSLALNLAYLLQAFSAAEASSPVEALGTAAAGAFVGYLIADLWSGLLHWSLDNYGSRGTPVFGAIIDSFQGHHASPWTITHRPFENNVHKVTYAALPLLGLLRLADPGLFGVAMGVAFLFGSLMSNEFHKYSHMVEPPPMVQALQGLGLSISRKQHGRHHSGTFDEKYCLVSGICNGPMDNFGVFRFLERAVYQANGVEPIAWKLDPSLKEVALSTGWLPFAAAPRVGVDAVARNVDGERKTEFDPTS